MIKRIELPIVAARRELEEETSIAAPNLLYLFEFGGLQKRHHVFFTQVPQGMAAQARNEIARCEWFDLQEMAALKVSSPTREIVHIAYRHSFVAIVQTTRSGETPSQS